MTTYLTNSFDRGTATYIDTNTSAVYEGIWGINDIGDSSNSLTSSVVSYDNTFYLDYC